MNQEQELAKMSGEDTIKSPEKYIVPTIQLAGKVGNFVMRKINDKGVSEKIDLGNTVNGVMLKVRRSYFHFTKTTRLYTNEHNSFRDNITVFESTQMKDLSWKSQMLYQGTCQDVKAKFPELKMKQAIYFLYKGEITKLFVKGKGLSNLFDYWKEFSPKEHIFQFYTELGSVEEESPLGNYFATTFKRGSKLIDITEVAEKIAEVAANVEKVESYYANYAPPENGEEVMKEKIEMPKPEDIPIIEEEPEEEIDVKDIPF